MQTGAAHVLYGHYPCCTVPGCDTSVTCEETVSRVRKQSASHPGTARHWYCTTNEQRTNKRDLRKVAYGKRTVKRDIQKETHATRPMKIDRCKQICEKRPMQRDL